MGSRARIWAARVAVAIYLATAFLLVGAEGSRAETYTVTTTADAGEGSLRQAIIAANSRLGEDLIRFEIQPPPSSIPDPDPTAIIVLSSRLPDIVDPVTIDATTQPGYVDRPLVEVRGPVVFDELGAHPAGPGLVLADGSTGSIVRGLSLTRFTVAILLSAGGSAVQSSWIGVGVNSDAGPNDIGIQANGNGNTVGPGNVISFNDVGVQITGDDNIIVGNRIGLDPSGQFRAGNFQAGISLQEGADRNRIGGTGASDRNVISGNVVDGIRAQSATDTTILGNYIGTDLTGTVSVGNSTGIRLDNSRSTVGGTAPGAGNLISGNIGLDTGIAVFNSGGTTIQGNFIGTDATGSVALGNDGAGISLESGQGYLVAGNVISGNGSFVQGDGGLVLSPVNGIEAFFLSDLTIQGNRIGTTAAGDRALPNRVGIALFDTAAVLVGGTAPGQGNVISGNQGPGVELPCFEFPGGPGDTTLQGNLIGTNAAGTAAVPNLGGITVNCGTGTLVGGAVAGAGNVISGNNGHGIFDQGTDEIIQGNRIGVDVNGNAMGNAGSGVYVGSTFPEVGGDAPGEGNIIAFNQGDGVTILVGTGNPIRLNSIHDNGGLGIDLNDDGPSPNDAGDPDLGANLTQNFPVLTSAVGIGGVATISGTLDTEPGDYIVDFYGNPTLLDAEGETYLGSFTVTVGTAGPTTFSAPNIPLSQPFVTATATDVARLNTSEFSPVIAAKFPVTITTQASPSVPVGGQIFDTATLAGDVRPAGTVVFRLYGPNDAECAGPPAATFSMPVVADQFVYQSPSFTATAPGTYRFVAEYQEPEVAPVTTACNDPAEAVVVTQATPTITTQASPGVAVGGSISDTATVSGGFNPTGTVTFNLYGPDDATCSGTPAFTQTVTLINFSATSGPFEPTLPGTYRWVASYSGDANNAPVSGVCGDPAETVVVSPAPTTTTSTTTTLPPTTTTTSTTLPPTTTTTTTTLPPTTTTTSTTLPPTTTTTTTTLPPTTTTTSTTLPPTTTTTTTLPPTTTSTSTTTTLPPTTTSTSTTAPPSPTSTSTTSTTEPEPETTTTSSTTTTPEPTTTTIPPTTTTSSTTTTTTTTTAPPVPAGTTTTVTSAPAVTPTPTTAPAVTTTPTTTLFTTTVAPTSTTQPSTTIAPPTTAFPTTTTTAPRPPGPASTLNVANPDGEQAGPPGVGLDVSGGGYLDCDRVYFFFDGVRIGSDTPDANGAVGAGRLSAPGNAKPGEHRVTSSCNASGEVVRASNTFLVTDATFHRTGFATSLAHPDQLSLELERLATSAVVAVALLLLFAFPFELFNSSVEENYDEIRGWFHLPPRLVGEGTRVGRIVSFFGLTAITAVVVGFLSPDFGLNLNSVVLALGFMVALLVMSLGFSLPADIGVHRRTGEWGKLNFLPGTLLVSIVMVALSRIFTFQPGYFYGALAGLAFASALSKADQGKLTTANWVWSLVLSVGAWFLRMPVSEAAAQPDASVWWIGVEACLVLVFLWGIEGLVVAMLPMRFLDGRKVIEWNRVVWSILMFLGLFGVVHVLLSPSSGYVGHTTGEVTVGVIVLFLIFGAISVGVWAYFRYRPERWIPKRAR